MLNNNLKENIIQLTNSDFLGVIVLYRIREYIAYTIDYRIIAYTLAPVN